MHFPKSYEQENAEVMRDLKELLENHRETITKTTNELLRKKPAEAGLINSAENVSHRF